MCLKQSDLKLTEQGPGYFDAPTNLARTLTKFAVGRGTKIGEIRD